MPISITIITTQKDNEEPAYGLAYLESSKGNNSISRYMYGYDYTTNFVDTGTWIIKYFLIIIIMRCSRILLWFHILDSEIAIQ
jgi:hypothetical protein